MARKDNKDGAYLHFGTLSLPVIACVLAAVLFMSEQEAPPIALNPNDVAAVTAMESQVTEVKARLEGIRGRIEKAVAIVKDTEMMKVRIESIELELARLRKETKLLAGSVSESQERAALVRQIADKTKEASVLSNEVKKVEGLLNEMANSIELSGLDQFPQPYVSIDCGKEEAKIYSPRQAVRTFRLPLTDAESTWLRKQVELCQAVIVFARAASFDKSYWEFRKVVKAIQEDNARMAVSYVPIQDHESVAKYIQIGVGE